MLTVVLPSTLAPNVYWMCAVIRKKHSTPQQEMWITKGTADFDGHRADHCRRDGLSKAFDDIPIDITFGVCEAMGVDERLFVGLKGMDVCWNEKTLQD